MKLGDMLGLGTVEGKVLIENMKIKLWKAYQGSDEKTREEEKTVAKDFDPPCEWTSSENIG